MPAYTHTTLAVLRAQLAARLGDLGMVYWVSAELDSYIAEALRTWGLVTAYWRDRGTFTTVAGTALYDIRTLKNSSNEDLLSYSVTDTTLCSRMQYHLLELATGTTWTGSEQFTLADVTSALQTRRDLLLSETGTVVTHVTQFLAPGSDILDVPDTTLAMRRLAWTAGGTTYPLTPDDINSQRNYTTSFMLTPDIPLTYSTASMKSLRYQLAPPTNQPGTADMLLVQSGATLTAQGVALGVPDDMSWIVKWGALADLLGKEGPGQDLPRAYFCERRWKLGLALAQKYPVVINAQLNGLSTSPDSIGGMDLYRPNWQSTQGAPDTVLSMQNIIGLSTCPDGVYSVVLDVVRKAPIPVVDGDFVQIGREYVSSILDYAEHLAAFKCGGQELRHTYRTAENFFRTALDYNQALAAQNSSLSDLFSESADPSYVPQRRKTGPSTLENVVQAPEQIN